MTQKAPSEWLAVEESKYDELIPLYKKRAFRLQLARYSSLALLLVYSFAFPAPSLVVSILMLGFVSNFFLAVTSKVRILNLKVVIMEHIREGTIDTFLE